MTDPAERVARLRRLMSAIPAPPWHERNAECLNTVSAVFIGTRPSPGREADNWDDAGHVVAITHAPEVHGARAFAPGPVAEFIVEARAAVPLLCDELLRAAGRGDQPASVDPGDVYRDVLPDSASRERRDADVRSYLASVKRLERLDQAAMRPDQVLEVAADLARVARDASPAPWFVCHAPDDFGDDAVYVGLTAAREGEWADPSQIVALTRNQDVATNSLPSVWNGSNDTFIVAARSALPHICDALARAWGRR